LLEKIEARGFRVGSVRKSEVYMRVAEGEGPEDWLAKRIRFT